jgi:hypothetical protein
MYDKIKLHQQVNGVSVCIGVIRYIKRWRGLKSTGDGYRGLDCCQAKIKHAAEVNRHFRNVKVLNMLNMLRHCKTRRLKVPETPDKYLSCSPMYTMHFRMHFNSISTKQTNPSIFSSLQTSGFRLLQNSFNY